MLGKIYYEGKYVKSDLNKSIYYYTLSANQNNRFALLFLGMYNLINSSGIPIKGIDLLIRASSAGNTRANFIIGYCYHEGKYIQQDIEKMLHYYKLGSSFNDVHAKNNLGIIYKNGIGTIIQQNIGYAIEYFEEAAKRFNDKICIYNLSHIYIFEEKIEHNFDKAIDLLIKSCQQFYPSLVLLCLVLIMKHGFDLVKIKQNIHEKTEQWETLYDLIFHEIYKFKLYNDVAFQMAYEYYKSIDFLYDFKCNLITQKQLNEQILIQQNNNTQEKVTKEFYEGFEL